MKQKLTLLSLTLVTILVCNLTFAQDNNLVERWNKRSTRAFTGGTYSQLPSTFNYVNPNTTTKIIHTSQGDVLVPPNVIPFPTVTATESEVAAVNMGGNNNTMYASWNSYGPSFYGTGFCLSTNGGASWTGSYNNMNNGNNGGDPGPFIWPAGSTWAGRLGTSDLNGPYNAVIGFYSTDNGATWSAPVNMQPSGTNGVDKNLSCVDDVVGSPFFGRAYTLWSDFRQTRPPIVACYTSDGGATWPQSGNVVSPADDGAHYCQGVDVQVGPGGVVYAVWAYVSTGSLVEDYMGFAKSTNGGVTWSSQNNNAVNTNGIRGTIYNGCRSDGFPRIAVDKSGTGTNGYVYATMSEKTVAPARDNSDICLCKSTDGGATWSHTLVNGDPAGGYNWHGAAAVSPTGTLAISYYDTRNTTAPVTQFYLSFSNNGGVSFSDVQVSDHNFTPAPISGLAGGYQGDYTGLTWSNGKFWPFWADPSTGHYQVWTAGVSTVVQTHDFSCGPFLSLPQGNLLINTNYNIKTRVANIGSSNETTVPIKFFVNGNLTATTNINLNAGGVDSVNNVWTTPTAGTYNLMYVSALSTDLDRTNDTVRATVTVLSVLPALCEDFTTATFPPTGWSEIFSGTNYWSRSGVSRVGVGSLVYDMWNAPSGTVQSMITQTFPPTIAGTALAFVFAYQPFGTAPDSLVFYASTNAGTTWTEIPNARYGNTSMGTTTGNASPFTPTASQWASKLTGVLPTGTNKIQVYGRSGFGDNMYVDSVCLVTPSGITHNGNEVPKVYSLSQNYPNPFNPSTSIQYALPKAGFVTLKIYDVLGKEVSTLVNEMQQPGTYNFRYDASNLASGVYFYRIDVGDGSFSQIKKMMLIK